MKQMGLIQSGKILSTLITIMLVISACQTATSQTTPITLPSSTPVAEPALFPLNGSWLGGLQKDSQIINLTVELDTTCVIGGVCGTFTLIDTPCSDTLTLLNEDKGVYEFQAGGPQGTCGHGIDHLSQLDDGTMQFTSQGDLEGYTGILDRKIPVIFDDDGSSDGTVALMYLLSDPRVSLKAVTVSYGVSDPQIYIQYLAGLLESFGITDIPLGAGKNNPIIGTNSFPESIRQNANAFWGMPIPNTGKTYPITDASSLIISTLNDATEPYTILVTGPGTNLATALLLGQGITKHVKSVFLMGGAVYTHGNLPSLTENPPNLSAEWNIYSDPEAATVILNSGLDIYLIPIDVTNLVEISPQDTALWRQGGPQSVFAADLYDSLLRNAPTHKKAIWDVTAAELMVKPIFCGFTDLKIEVVTEGDIIGQTNVIQKGTPNTHVCLDLAVGEIIKMLDFMLMRSQ